MTYSTADNVFDAMSESKQRAQVGDVMRLAIEYARLRVDHLIAPDEKKQAVSRQRSMVHNALIKACDALAAAMDQAHEDTRWREWLGNDRKDIGDFACYVHCMLGIEAGTTKVDPVEPATGHMPGWNLLGDAEPNYRASQEAFVREKAQVLEQSLREFGIDASVVEINTGPVITMYEITMAAGTKVAQIQSLQNDIARAMAAANVRIVVPIPGKNTVGIEVPNAQREKVRLKELMQLTSQETQAKMNIPLFLGKDANGEPLVADLVSMPHCLIAGITGSGKSVCINTIIMSVMYTHRPDNVKLVLCDPKIVEMAPFKGIPHLMCPVITETGKAISVLEWACEKMDERYELLAEAAVRNIAGYNNLTSEELFERFNATSDDEKAKVPKHLPYIVIIINELADLMMTSGKEVERLIVRLAQKARAAGIHLIIATQRPQATVVTGMIRANMPCKIAFRVADKMDSRTMLDQTGAELLLGHGDMLYLPGGAGKPVRSLGTFIDDKEIRDSVMLVSANAKAQYDPELIQLKSAIAIDGEGGQDEMLELSVRVRSFNKEK